MKKLVLLIAILSVSVFTTACINNLAVQELNNKAAEYMKKGDYENAISRLNASIDLDGNIFETQYNLAIAYTENEDYEEAIGAFEKAIELNDKSADLYYSMAVMYENYAKDLYSGNTKAQKEALEDSENDSEIEFKLSDNELDNVKKYYQQSIDSYSKYVDLASNSQETSEVLEKIKEINEKLETLDSGVDTN